jgi:hypothetical protein
MIAIDHDEMNGLRKQLRDAADGIGETVPRMTGAGAFGPAVLAEAASMFESTMRREARSLSQRWMALDFGVGGTLDDRNHVEAAIVEGVTGRLTRTAHRNSCGRAHSVVEGKEAPA